MSQSSLVMHLAEQRKETIESPEKLLENARKREALSSNPLVFLGGFVGMMSVVGISDRLHVGNAAIGIGFIFVSTVVPLAFSNYLSKSASAMQVFLKSFEDESYRLNYKVRGLIPGTIVENFQILKNTYPETYEKAKRSWTVHKSAPVGDIHTLA